MTKLVKLIIDDHPIEAPDGMLIVDAAKKYGIDIPVFCYHPKLEPVGMCRMCLVEIGRPVKDRNTGDWVREADGSLKIQFGPKLETACTTPVSEGMVVRGNNPRVAAARKDILEFLLTSHPLDCPICDKGGECPLQNLTMGYGPGQSRFIYDEKYNLGKHVPLGELIMLDRERCIQCARCIRFQDEIVDDPVIGFFQRGRALEIITFSEPGFDSYYSGNTTDICPVGALTTVDFRFEARPWELNSGASICSHCPVGCNTTINIRREARAGGDTVIKRVMPRQNELVNEIWICDKGRFAYHYTQSDQRLNQPLVRKNGELQPASWEEALTLVADRLRGSGEGLMILAGGRLSNEDLFNAGELAKSIGGKPVLYTPMAGGDLVAQVGAGQGTNFKDMGPGSVIVVVACDLQEEAPIWWLQVKQAHDRGATVISVNPRQTRLDAHATRVLRYPYGSEAVTMLAMVNSLSAKRPDLGENSPKGEELRQAGEIAQIIAQAENALIIYGSEGTGLDSSKALAQACANLLIATNHTGRANNGLVGAWPVANIQGAWDMGFRPAVNLKETIQNSKVLYAIAADPAGDDPALKEAVEAAEFVVVQELFLTATARMADVVLPAQAYTEREGTYTSGLRRVQRFYPALPPRPECYPDFSITAQIGARLGFLMEERIPMRVMERIAAEAPDYSGVTYHGLANVAEQWPIVGRQDMYYGGTTYENVQGLGIQLAPAVQRGAPVTLGWVEPEKLPKVENGLLGVPVTRLYDRAQTVLPSHMLRARIPAQYVAIHPDDAGRLGVSDGEIIQVEINGIHYPAAAHLDELVPAGILLIPRSMGFPVSGPVVVGVQVAESAVAGAGGD
ncbi:MAG: NADH-quinone oxidoreductase subunit NuoG [Omnitrophica WOR_2 bacterium]